MGNSPTEDVHRSGAILKRTVLTIALVTTESIVV